MKQYIVWKYYSGDGWDYILKTNSYSEAIETISKEVEYYGETVLDDIKLTEELDIEL
jgi:hypothetical protein